jgi:hypothetical protein
MICVTFCRVSLSIKGFIFYEGEKILKKFKKQKTSEQDLRNLEFKNYPDTWNVTFWYDSG